MEGSVSSASRAPAALPAPVIARQFPLAAAREAHALVGRGPRGRVFIP